MKLVTSLLATVLAVTVFASPSPLTLVRNGMSAYRIVIPKATSEMDKHAAEELQSFLKQISGAELPIVTDDKKPTPNEIVLGACNRPGILAASPKLEGAINRAPTRDAALKEAFRIRTDGQRLFITGGPGRGTLYGVYAFLEDQLGCRWYTPTVGVIPHRRSVEVGPLDETQAPAMVYRDLYYGEARDRDFDLRIKINASVANPRPGQYEDVAVSGNGLAHTRFSFLAPDKYFATHPEYFALRDGKRVPNQLCLSNPAVLHIVVENLGKLMKTNPKAKYWSVSQMDNGDFCQCEQCKALDDREGAPSASVLNFVNKVAEQFPDKYISTLAYWYTTGPPKTLKPARNVHIVFCTEFDWRPPFREWYEGWAKIVTNWYTWSYVIPCHNIIAPWPNIPKLQDNVRDLIGRGSTGMFVEGCGEVGSEFAELRVYLLAKLMWNPNIDGSATIDDFLIGYYGAAGPPLRRYINEMYKSMVDAGDALSNHDWSSKHAGSCFSPKMLARYDELFDEAEKAVALNPPSFCVCSTFACR